MSIKVMIVDDSNFMRKALAKLISSDDDFEIVAQISNGQEALDVIPTVQPNVIILDIEMEGMDGLTTLKHIMASNPTPVIMFSAHTKKGAEITLKSLQEGAVDFMEKPSGSISMDLGAVRDELINKIRIATRVTPVRQIVPLISKVKTSKSLILEKPSRSVIAIASSTGGVQALHSIIPKLPGNLPLPIVIVQHMPPIFTKSLAESLNSESRLNVIEATHMDKLKAGCVYLAPGGYHMSLRRGTNDVNIHIDKEPESEPLRPSADVLFSSVAETFGKNTLAIVLTGMGNDGTKGLIKLRAQGAKAIAQDKNSSVVYGMPKSAKESAGVDLVLPISQIAEQITLTVKMN
jgi:two-component system chemotaxis response regulator CheB